MSIKHFLILAILLLVIVIYVSPTCVSCCAGNKAYINSQELKKLAKNGNPEALKILHHYYKYNRQDQKNAWLVSCAKYQFMEKHTQIELYGENNKFDKQCPNNPINKINHIDNFFDLSNYVWCRILQAR